MPNYDQTGPEGQGPLSGKKMGRCTNYGDVQKNKQSNPEPPIPMGRGFGRNFRNREMNNGPGVCGRGRGMGRQNRFRGGF